MQIVIVVPGSTDSPAAGVWETTFPIFGSVGSTRQSSVGATINPFPAKILAAIAGPSPTTDGTSTDDGPIEIWTITVSSKSWSVPDCGSVLTTLPSATESLLISSTETAQPNSSSSSKATDKGWPVRFGMKSLIRPSAIRRPISVVGSMNELASGSCSATTPASYSLVLILRTSIFTKPWFCNLLKASSWVRPTTIGTCIDSGPTLMTSATVSPSSNSVPCSGNWLRTLSEGTSFLTSVVIRPTWSPRDCNNATAWLLSRSITSGTIIPVGETGSTCSIAKLSVFELVVFCTKLTSTIINATNAPKRPNVNIPHNQILLSCRSYGS